jgi:triacylglycerol esterase/lipase EstA (alpha/beta hydrolase family)
LDKPVSVRTTYYIGTLDSSGTTFIQSSEASRSINEYGERLSKVVDIVLHHTGKKKVIIIAHSMGGLVSRAYIENYGGESKVDKLIEIGSPNHGIYGGLISISTLCKSIAGIITLHAGQECDDMQHDSSFLSSLNSGDETPGNVKYLTIAGSCDSNGEDYHDEVIRVGSVKLEGATNKVVNGQCGGLSNTFHGRLISPSQTPEVYNLVKDFIFV